MTGFTRRADGTLTLQGSPLLSLIESAGTPLPAFVYDLDGIVAGAEAMQGGFGAQRHLAMYAVKANSTGSIVRALGRVGFGTDVVSGGELLLALSCGIEPRRIVISGVAKEDWEIDLALAKDVHAIQCESVEEVERVLARAATLKTHARITTRINPSVKIDSHSHIATGHDKAKFGIALVDLPRAFERVDAAPHATLVGLSTHVGSMLTQPSPYLDAASKVCDVAKRRLDAGKPLEYVNFGGGFGIRYGQEQPAPPADFVRAAVGLVNEQGLGQLELLIEPGRALVGEHGILVAEVIQQKKSAENRWLMVNAGMNDLLRPALYQAHHKAESLSDTREDCTWRVVGPVCESADDFGNHQLGEDAPSHVLFRNAGAYSFCMASEYNGRPLASELVVSGGKVISQRSRDTAEEWARRRAAL